MDIDAASEKFVVIGDRVLLKPRSQNERTRAGLYLPPSVTEKEKVRSGYVVKVGPGFPIPFQEDSDEAWKSSSEKVKYIPLQVHVGDLAIYVQKDSHEIEFNSEEYIILPQSSILMLIRDEGLFE